MSLTQDLTDKMSQSELLGKVGWNSIKAFITSVILIAAFFKGMELINNYTLLVISQVICTIIFSMIVYYYYFWSGKGDKGSLAFIKKTSEDQSPLTLKDFFYTTRIESIEHSFGLVSSFIAGVIIELAFLIIIGVMKFSAEHSNSNETMSMLRVVVIGIAATALCIYTQRNYLNDEFWRVIIISTAYGFLLSITTYLLGMIIGISNMVLGVPVTLALLILQITFTAFYTYADLLEWSKKTHVIKVKETIPEESTTSGDKTEA